MTRKRILIVGGVAGGASCAARARRLDEDAEIIVFERGPYVSFANCGLPYYVGNVIQEEKKLLLSSPEMFKQRFNIDVRTENEVVAIDRAACEVEIKRVATGELYRERYDALVLAPGAAPIRPPLPGSACRVSSPCEPFPTAMPSRLGLPNAAPRRQSWSALDSSAWKPRRTSPTSG